MQNNSKKTKNDDYKVATKGFLRNEFKQEFKQELKDELISEITEMVDIKLQGVVDVISKQLSWITAELKTLREDSQCFWRKFDQVDQSINNNQKQIQLLDSRVTYLENE